jgi:hypothetical protein
MAKKKSPVKKSQSAPVADWSAVEKFLEAWEKFRAAERKQEGKKAGKK